MSKIIAKQNTLLKKEAKQSSELDSSKLANVEKGKAYPVKKFGHSDNGHTLVTLDYGAGVWYIFDDHWEIEGLEGSSSHPDIQEEIKRLRKYAKSYNSSIKPKFFSQRDNYTMPHRTCNSSANAMYLDWLMRQSGKPGLSGDNGYLSTVLKRGDTIYHGVQTWAIKQYGYNTKWMTDRDLSYVRASAIAKIPVVVNILHRGSVSAPRGGHIILITGYENGNFIVNDPYGSIHTNYRSNSNGRGVKISESEFIRRWQGGYRRLSK